MDQNPYQAPQTAGARPPRAAVPWTWLVLGAVLFVGAYLVIRSVLLSLSFGSPWGG
jgi:hypothetical protein